MTKWKCRWDHDNNGVVWDTPMANWCGKEGEWINVINKGRARTEDFTRVVLNGVGASVVIDRRKENRMFKSKKWELGVTELAEPERRRRRRMRGEPST